MATAYDPQVNYSLMAPGAGGFNPAYGLVPQMQQQPPADDSILSLVYYKDQKDAATSHGTNRTAFATATVSTAFVQADITGLRDKQAAVNADVQKYMDSAVNAQLISALLRAKSGGDMTLAAVLLIR